MKPKKKKKRTGLIIALLLVIAGAGGYLAYKRVNGGGNGTEYEFVSIERGDIENIVSSSGSINAAGTINVLAQMNGTVEKIYVDYNQRVKKHQRLLDLDTELIRIRAKEAEAAVLKSRASYEHSLLEYDNNLKLYEKKLISDFDLHNSKTNLRIAEANLASAEAQLERIEIELGQYALILSPIDGIVLDRKVDVGDTVVSGTTSTAMFTLAEDLAEMEIHAEVDELDISRIRTGQEVRFTVDAYPDDTFYGTVREIRLIPQTVNNIVTYTVIVDAQNPDGKLMPGMTANADFLMELKENVLKVPSVAFRFQPSGEAAAEAMKKLFEARIAGLPEKEREKARERFEAARKAAEGGAGSRSSGGLMGGGMPIPGAGRPPGSASSNGGVLPGPGGQAGGQRKPLWYLDEEQELAVLMVETGATDGTSTEIIGPPELEGKKVVLKIKADA